MMIIDISFTKAVHDQLKLLPSSRGIIYASSQKHVEDIYEYLNAKSMSCEAYHGGLSSERKDVTLKGFVSGAIPLVVATNALGMGIDIPDLRFVCHAELSKSQSALLQETGRCGRDNEEATSIIIFGKRDIGYNTFITGNTADSYQVYNTVTRPHVCLRVSFNAYLVDINSEEMMKNNSCEVINPSLYCSSCASKNPFSIHDISVEILQIISVVRDESTTIKRSWVAFKNKYQSLPESRKVVSSESAFTIVIYRMVGFEIITIDDEQKLKVCDDNNEYITSLPYMLTRYEK